MTSRIGTKAHVFGRVGFAIALAALLAIGGLVGQSARIAHVSAASTHAAAEITPDDVLLYADLSLDSSAPQWVQTNALLEKLGTGTLDDSVDSVTKSVSGKNVGISTTDDGFEGGEAALVVLNLDTVSQQASGASGSLTDLLGGLTLPSTGDTTVDSGSGAVAIIKPGDLVKASAAVASDLDAAATANGTQVETTTYKDVQVKSVAAAIDGSSDSGQAYAVVRDFIVYGTTQADIEPIIDTAAGDISALAQRDGFNAADTALTGDRLIFGFLSGSSIVDSINSMDTSGFNLGTSLGPIFGGGRDTGFTFSADDPGFRLESVEIPAADASKAEAAGTAADLTLADRVPSDTAVFVNGYNLGSGTLLQGLGLTIVSALSGLSGLSEATPTPVLDADALYAQAAKLLGINLKTNFIDQMVGQYAFALWGVDPDDLTKISAILVSGVESPSALSNTVGSLSFLIQAAAQGSASVTTVSMGDATVNQIELGDPATPVKVNYGVLNDQFVLGVGDGVTTYAQTIRDPLSKSENYQAALAELPAEYDGVLYLDVRTAISAGTELSSGSASMLLDGTPVAVEGTPVATYNAARAFATVSHKEDGLAHTSSILLIGGDN